MNVNTMYVYYNTDRLPYKDKERSVHYPIVGNSFVGASNTTKIRFYIDRLGESDATWVSIAKLPNGKTGSQLLSVYHDDEIDEWYAEMNLTNFYTQYKGDVYVSLNGITSGSITYNEETGLFETDGSPVIEATGSIKLAINYAPQYVGGDIEDGVGLEDVLGMLGNKLNKNSPHYVKKVSAIAYINNDTYADYLVSGDIIYSVSEEELYKLSGTHPSLVATIIEHGLVIPTNATFPYSLSDIELAKLSHNDSFLVFGDEILSINDRSATIINLDKIEFTSIGDGEYVLTKVYANVDIANQEIINISALTEHFYSTDKIDSLLETIRGNEFTLVNTTQFPTLQSFLLSTGQEGVVYLYPVGDVQNNYYKYIWESNRWVSLGTTEFDFSQYYNKTEIDEKLSAKEDIANKVTTLSALSTNTQYPSAKVVYDNLQDIREVAEGKTNTFVLSYNDTIAIIKNQIQIGGSNQKFMVWNSTTNEFEDKTTELLNGDYDEVSVKNNTLAVQNDLVMGSGSFIFRTINNLSDNLYLGAPNSTYFLIQDIISFAYSSGKIKVGDIFWVVETNVPDRWVGNIGTPVYLYKMEPSKVDLNNLYAKNNDLIPSSNNTYNIGSASGGYFNTIFLHSSICFGSTNSGPATIEFGIGPEPNVSFRFTAGTYNFRVWGDYVQTRDIRPLTTETYDIGTSSTRYKDMYLSGNVNVGGNVNFSGYLKGGTTLTQAQYDALVSGGTVDSDTFYFIEEE